jgi:hypothetical protein
MFLRVNSDLQSTITAIPANNLAAALPNRRIGSIKIVAQRLRNIQRHQQGGRIVLRPNQVFIRGDFGVVGAAPEKASLDSCRNIHRQPRYGVNQHLHLIGLVMDGPNVTDGFVKSDRTVAAWGAV